MPATPRSIWPRRLLLVIATIGMLATACGNSNDGKADAGTTSTVATNSTSTSGGGAVASVDAPGVTNDEIRFSVISTKDGNPLGTCILDCYVDGIKAYFAYRNSQGGVDGRKLVVSKQLDDQVAQNQARSLEVISANDTFATFDAPILADGFAELAKAGVPLYTWAINFAEMAGKDSIFGNREPICLTCTMRADAYVAKLAGAKKVASLGYGATDNSKQCAQSASESIKAYSKDIGGAKSVYLNDNLQFGLPNGIGPEVTAMKDAGVDLVIACLDLNGMKAMAQEFARQGMEKVVLYHMNTYNQQFVRDAGGVFDGDYVGAGFRPFEASPNDASAAYTKWMKKNGSEPTELSMVGWLNADLAYQGIKAAGPSFDRQKVIDATNKMTNYTASGLIQPIDWSRQHVPPTQDDPATHGPPHDCVALVKVKSGEFQVVGDKSKPWFCWPGNTRAWSEPTPTAFK